MKEQSIVSIDAGDKQSGGVLIRSGSIVHGVVLSNEQFIDWIEKANAMEPVFAVIEDVRPYGVRLSQNLIDTCKFIGELCYRLKTSEIAFALIPRYEVKKWCFDSFPAIVAPLIAKKIEKKNLVTQSGEMRKPSFVFVDDRIVAACMRHHWNFKKPKPGHKHELGLSTHSWQALGLATFFLSQPKKV